MKNNLQASILSLFYNISIGFFGSILIQYAKASTIYKQVFGYISIISK